MYTLVKPKILHVALRPRTFTLFRLPLLEAQREKGIEIEIACCLQHPQYQTLIDSGFKINVLPLDDSYTYFSVVQNTRAIFWLKKLIRAKNFNVVHTHQPIGSFIGLSAGILARCPKLFHTTGGLKSAEEASRIKGWLFKFVEKRLLARTDAVFSVNETDLATMVDDWGFSTDQVFYVGPYGGCGLDLSKYNPEEVRQLGIAKDVKTELGIPVDGRVICTVSRLVWEKGYREFVEAAPALLKLFPDLWFVIVGDGPDQDAIKELAVQLDVKDRVVFCGRRDDVPRLLSIADVFMTASHREAFGLAAAEAMAMKVPVVVSDARGLVELVSTDGEYGLVVSRKATGEFVEAIASLLQDSELARTIGDSGRRRLRDNFSRELLLQKHLDLIETLLAAEVSQSPRTV